VRRTRLSAATRVPFGPYLATAGFIVMLFGERLPGIVRLV
jgi:prepilin signal peptidase PulO-like enzyme (type II secretory pathway)